MKKITLLIMLLLTSILFANTYTVKQDGTGNFESIYEAINDQNVIDGDIILVYPDIYYENIAFFGKNITVASLYFTTYNSSYISNTIIDGNESGPVVSFKHGESNEAVLCGFTIQNGLGGDYPNHTGGGINITNGSSPTLQNLIITNNSSGFAGGGIFCSSSNPSISDITITENTTQEYGAGICVENLSHITVNNVNIINNQTLEIYPFTEGIYVYGDSIGSYIQYDPESERNVGKGGGVCLYYSDAVFDNVIIDSNISTEGAGLWGWSSNATFDECEITNNSSEGSPFANTGGVMCIFGSNFNLTNSIINNNSSYSCIGGITCNQNSTLVMENSEICGNNANDEAGGLSVTSGSHAELLDVLISGNSTTGFGGGIFYVGSGYPSPGSLSLDRVRIINNSAGMGGGLQCSYQNIYLSNVLISQNSAEEGSGLWCVVSNPIIKNSTFTLNTSTNSGGAIYCTQNSNPELVNTILWDNLPQEIFFDENDLPNSIDIDYSDIEGGKAGIITNNNGTVNWGTGNTGTDPQFADPSNGDYNLTDASPCVDTGDPSFPPDPDGTTIEMGCYYYPHPDYDIHRLSKGYNWESFPRIGIEDNNNDETNIVPILEDIDPFGDITNIIFDADGIYDLTYNGTSWAPPSYLAQSSWLYKIQTLPGEERLLTVNGEKLPATFDLSDEDPLEAGTCHWLGFWLPRNQKMIESFGDYWENVAKVYSEDWYYSPANNQRGGDPTYPCAISAENLILKSGKGYMVLFKDLEEPITDFHWTLSDAAEEPKKKNESESFTYTEKADYEAIDVFNIPPNVTEIGVFEDDVCVGAITVEDTCAQILVYSDNVNRDPIPFTFEVVTGRGFSTPVKDYQVLNLQTGKYETKSIFSGRQDYSIIRFGDEDEPENNTLSILQLHGNYPNPFNPTTTISFSLPDELEIELSIYNIKGQKVKQLINGQLTAGQHSMIWDGKDTNEKSVGTGIYFYKLKTGNDVLTRKMLMLK